MNIDELKELERKATPGPWTWSRTYEMAYRTDPEDEWNPDEDSRVYTEKHWAIVDPESESKNSVTSLGLVSLSRSKAHGEFGFLDDPNVQLVTAARNALPALIAEIERLRKVEDAALTLIANSKSDLYEPIGDEYLAVANAQDARALAAALKETK